MRLCFVVLLTALQLGVPQLAGAAEQTVNVYNWSDYIAPAVLKQFQKETGVRVVYDQYDSNEMLEAKLLVGGSGFDVVFPTARPFAQRHLQKGVYQPLDRAQVPNIKNLDPRIVASLQDVDPGLKHVVPYTWGTTGIGYNKKAVTKRLGATTPVNTWALLFNPLLAAKLSDCGITVLDDPEEALHSALIYLGKDPSSAAPADLDAAIALYKSVRKYIKYFHSSQYITDLATGDVCVSMGYSGDIIQARNRARDAKNGVEVGYAVPREGAIMWVDLMAIPKDAPHTANAFKFVNFILRADVMAAISNEIAYANANAASFRLLKPELRNDPGVYPSAKILASLKTAKNLGSVERRARNRAFTRIRSGK